MPKARIQKKSRLVMLFWLAPVAAVGLCGSFIYRDLIAGGPTVTIFFQNGDGLEVKNTLLKYRGAQVGQVNSLELTKDLKYVKVTTRMAGPAEMLAREGSVFWIVRPEVRVGAVSGLGTIVSGAYIGVQPGNGPRTNVFMGAEKEPTTEEPGALQISLTSPDLGSLQESSPIFYRGIQVGEVLHFQLGDDSKEVVIRARIQADYAPLVREDTKFWNAGGIDFHLGLFKGVQISAESPRTLLSGGIEFATPPELAAKATNGASFVLYDKPEDKWKTWEPAVKLNLPAEATQTNAPPNLNLK